MKKYTIDLLITEATHSSGMQLYSPLHQSQIIRIDQSPRMVADVLQKAMEREWIKEGRYDFLLDQTQAGQWQKELFAVQIGASPEDLFPELLLEYDFFYTQNDRAQWVGVLPVLNVESTGLSFEELKSNLGQNLKLEFMRNERLKSVFSLLSTQQFSEVQLHILPRELTFYTFSEISQLQEQKQEKLLPQVAQKMFVSQPSLFGLEAEWLRLCKALKGQNRRSALIVGGAGKGKTALIQEFCRLRNELGLGHFDIWEVSAAQLLHRLTAQGSWEESLGELCRELRQTGDFLYVSNFAELFEVGQYIGNSLSMADFLRDFLARGDIRLLSECTPEEASRIELRSPGYLSLFATITISELSLAQILHTIQQKTQQFAEAKDTLVEEEAITEILRLQQWYTPYSELPGKTIFFLQAMIADRQKDDLKIIDRAAIHQRFSRETGMPEFMINPETPLNYAEMSQFFHQNIFGQEEAIQTVLDLLVSVKAAVVRRGKPLASLLFVGPTGVGKTEMAKVLAQFMFGNRNKMLRFDMSEYADLPAVMRLTGDSSGGDGLLTAAVRQAPFSVLLFDELEKVHPAFYDLLLQILGEGRLTDARGRVADFCSTIIIMTSNIGARSFQSGHIGFVESLNDKAEASAHFRTEVQNYFRPELFNRLDRIIAFSPLDRAVVRSIIDREVQLMQKREGLRGRNLSLYIDKAVLDYLGEVGYDPRYGARFLQRAIQEQMLIPLARQLNRHEVHKSLHVKIYRQNIPPFIQLEVEVRTEVATWHRKLEGQAKWEVGPFAFAVLNSRRKAGNIERGRYYNKFLSQLDRMERKLAQFKRKNIENEFWRQENERKRYYALYQLHEAFSASFQEIGQLDTDIFLLLAGLPEAENQLPTRFEAWQSRFEELKRELVLLENPQFAYCCLGIYGNLTYVWPLAQLFRQLGKAQGFAIQERWATYDHNKKEFEHNPHYPTELGPRKDVCGLELQFQGEMMPYLYFRRETGVHLWITRGNFQCKLKVQMENKKLDTDDPSLLFQTPFGVHRASSFNDETVMRYYYPEALYAPQHHSETQEGKPLEILQNLLDANFKSQIDGYLLG
ncbi:MAG: ATP-dependent Clp protease ATP-binding subunit [Microscillaceae bacterium]|nr:ATP-dependent Clp protease ATP-binding subunit [Microscillaceae bacterium]